ncbi:ATP-binding protein [Photobacterium sp. DNB23_23_1]|uniref:histidine kinase n=1 Tax=Photobacterium pectinilyticum TaxID=2906793 RepID=A0ABT1N3M5_9GAMM|nr:ATP-binding protein [Photobacterium sp. ZSDE20]MCQ1059345.1 ATP-binding protein [Photobacterium sp. ZSDE20]MDD1825604.1 ATP-binding protein [Photobacterium sp. ZSDE20]
MAIGMGLLINSSFKEGFQRFINQEEILKVEALAEKLTAYYSKQYGWKRLVESPHIFASMLRQIGEIPPPRGHHPAPVSNPASNPGIGLPPDDVGQALPLDKPSSVFVPLGVRVNLVSLENEPLLGAPQNLQSLPNDLRLEKVAVNYEGRPVGWITVLQSQSLSNELAESFLRSQTRNIVFISLVTLVVSLVFASGLVGYLLKPLRALHRGAESVQRGDLDFHIHIRGNDEVTDVIQAFNHLVASLKQQEKMREQWLSDISHELRTPLAVLRSELEALVDGIRQPEPRYMESLHHQVLNLSKLVEELRVLSLADMAGNSAIVAEPLELNHLLKPCLDRYERRLKEKQIVLHRPKADCQPMMVTGEQKKIEQVVSNLLENSYRYTDVGGNVWVSLAQKGAEVVLTIEDSAPGVNNEALPKLFDRLYRVDQSRSREHGGSGLGLAICKSILEAHKGHIHAAPSERGGIKMVVTLPRQG